MHVFEAYFFRRAEATQYVRYYPPKTVAVFSKRIQVAINGDPEEFKKGSAVCYAWYIWEQGYKDKPRIEWI